MPVLHVRNVPEPLYEKIRERAQEQNRSISAEVILLLDFAMRATVDGQAEVLDNIRRRRSFEPAAVGAPNSLSLLREDRER